jgi:hypothetical protein
MKIVIETIPHEEQRYPTVGDWQFKDDGLYIKVSKMSEEKREFLVGIHEAIEAYLARDAGVKEEDVDAFDIDYEEQRAPEDTSSEPGDDPLCPVYRQHQIACGIERILACELKVDWNGYEDEIESL